jgi:aerobic carbon-monoxide dehydrogenase small subunit
MKIPIEVVINGKKIQKMVEPRQLLVFFLRDQLRLTGTHIGCDTSSCGACTVHLDGHAVKSCTVLAAQTDGRSVNTIESIETSPMNVIQEGFKEEHGLQCGFCTPGMIMTTADLLTSCPNPSEHQIREALEGNICRCTGYHNIVKSVQYAAGKLQKEVKHG